MSKGHRMFWQPFEDEQIRVGYHAGEKVHSIAYRLWRNYGQIADRARQLGIQHKLRKQLLTAEINEHLPAMRPVDDGLALHCLNLFRAQRMDSVAIARKIGRHESEVVRMLHHAREAERA